MSVNMITYIPIVIFKKIESLICNILSNTHCKVALHFITEFENNFDCLSHTVLTKIR